MKTLKFVSLAIGILSCQLAFSFTTLNLPVDAIYENPVDNLYVSSLAGKMMDLNTEEITEVVTPNTEDTIVIELDEVVITAGFPMAAEQCILEQIKYPEFALKQQIEGIVALSLVFDTDGQIHVLETNSSSPEFESYVIGKLQTLHLKNCSVKVGEPYNVRFAFRLY
jgi:hypothetical protein